MFILYIFNITLKSRVFTNYTSCSIWTTSFHFPTYFLLTYLPTYSIEQDLLEKLIILELVKKFPTFYGTRMSITTFTSTRYLSIISHTENIVFAWFSQTRRIKPSWIRLSKLRLIPEDCFTLWTKAA
jgi:VanZ family protein